MKHLSIGSKIVLGFAAVIVVGVALMLEAVFRLEVVRMDGGMLIDVQSAQGVFLSRLAIAAVCGIAIAVWVARSAAAPLRELLADMERVSRRDLTGGDRRDRGTETGPIARAMEQMIESLRNDMSTLARDAETLHAAAEQLRTASTTVSDNSGETSKQATAVTRAVQDVTANIATVASSAEQMSASVREVSQRATEAAGVATEASTLADRTHETMSRLGSASAEIGKVVGVITSIAEQTNLLALNATIESARAGEAGKGFAVVAAEVKELARQTTSATSEIGARVHAIQDATARAVSAIDGISDVIRRIGAIQHEIASAVVEQASTIDEISRSSAAAAQGSAGIVDSVTGISEASRRSRNAAANSAAAAEESTRLAAHLRSFVGNFRFGARSEGTPTPVSTRDTSDPESPPGWDPVRMSTGNAEIDAQHKELFHRVAQLRDAVLRAAGVDEVKPMLDFLAEYAVRHFGFEEDLMERHQCPSRHANKEAHARFLSVFTGLVQRFERDEHPLEVLGELQRTLANWLTTHICGVDTKLKACGKSAATCLAGRKARVRSPAPSGVA
jgi:methyl-accepting chemotaxis protein